MPDYNYLSIGKLWFLNEKLDQRRWKVERCFAQKNGSQPNCWCRVITTVGKPNHEIVRYGEIRKDLAHFFVLCHNMLLKEPIQIRHLDKAQKMAQKLDLARNNENPMLFKKPYEYLKRPWVATSYDVCSYCVVVEPTAPVCGDDYIVGGGALSKDEAEFLAACHNYFVLPQDPHVPLSL